MDTDEVDSFYLVSRGQSVGPWIHVKKDELADNSVSIFLSGC